MSSKRAIALFIIIILLFGGWWTYQNYTPVVLSFAPADGGKNLPKLTVFSITFSQAMQTGSVEENLTITPQVEGDFTWQENALSFTPTEEWPEGTDVKIELKAGSKSELGLPLRQDLSWRFSISNTRLAYLWPLGVGANLYLLDVDGGDTKQLTFSKGLLDFDVDERNSLIYYTALNAKGGSDLLVIDYYSKDIARVLDCGQDYCSNVQSSFDGERLAFEKLDGEGMSSVWTMAVDGKSEQLSEDGHIADTAQWSPDGHLVYYDRSKQMYNIIDQNGDLEYQLENITGEPGTWSMTGQKFVVHEHFPFSTIHGLENVELYSSHLLSLNTFTKQLDNLSGSDNYIEDTEPSFSPDGRWLAFARTDLELDEIMIGRPMWLMRSDGSDQHFLIGDPSFRHSAFAWHPDAEQIAFLRSNTIVLTEPPEIWLTDVSNGSAFRLIIGGFDPLWTP